MTWTPPPGWVPTPQGWGPPGAVFSPSEPMPYHRLLRTLRAYRWWKPLLAILVAAAYYLRVLRVMWMEEPPDGDRAPIVTPQPVMAALAITTLGTIVLGVLPGLVMRFADLEDLTGALGG